MTIEHVTYWESGIGAFCKCFSLWHSSNDWHLAVHNARLSKHTMEEDLFSIVLFFIIYHFHINIIFAALTDTIACDIQVMLCTTGRTAIKNSTHCNFLSLYHHFVFLRDVQDGSIFSSTATKWVRKKFKTELTHNRVILQLHSESNTWDVMDQSSSSQSKHYFDPFYSNNESPHTEQTQTHDIF